MNIKESELYKKSGLKGIRHQLFTYFPFVLLALLALLYNLLFRVPETMFYFKLYFIPLILVMMGYYLYVAILFIKFIRKETKKMYIKINSTD